MFNAPRWIRCTFIVLIVILLFLSPLAVHKASAIFSADSEIPIYKISMTESTQRDIWKLCEENNLAYELVLAIYQVDGINDTAIDNMKAEIERLSYVRDYWTEQGFPDEIVFDLLLISRQRGIEGCKAFMRANDSYDSYDLDSYVQKVAEYKSYLEQSPDTVPVVKNGRTLVHY